MGKVGRTDLFVPPLILGGMARRESTDAQRIELFKAAIERGFSTIDTAPLYGFGRAEQQLGEALKQVPNGNIQVLTKVGLRWHGESHGDVLFEFTDDQGKLQQVRKDSRPESIRWEVTQSLERLHIETLDLVQIHHPDQQVPIAESIGALLDLQREGKLRHIGVSNFSADQIRDAQRELGDVPLCSAQPEYSLVRRDAESQIIPICRELNIGVLVYSPLAEGLLAGREITPSNPSLQKINQAMEEVLRPIARHHHVSEAAVSLSWVISQPGITAAISGASNVKQLDDQAQVFELELSESELAQLTSAFSDAPLPHSWEHTGTGLNGAIRRVRTLLGRALRKAGVDPSILRTRR